MTLIGIDPQKASHTAVAIDCDERPLCELQVRADRRQCERLLAWADPFDARTWAIESAGGLGSLLAQQLVAAGEHVVDVPATLSARVRVLGSGRSSKNDPNARATSSKWFASGAVFDAVGERISPVLVRAGQGARCSLCALRPCNISTVCTDDQRANPDGALAR